MPGQERREDGYVVYVRHSQLLRQAGPYWDLRFGFSVASLPSCNVVESNFMFLIRFKKHREGTLGGSVG